jgi:RNA polymerase sigma-70 factor, ECF subfamily
VAESGDERALSQLYDRYAGLVYGVGVRYLGDRALAEDLVQDVLTAVWRGAASFDLASALARLSPAHREVLTLAYFHGLSQSEIARRTNTPLGTVKSRTTAALRALRESMLTDEDG